LQHGAKGGNIGRGIAYGNRAVLLVVAVRFDVSGSSFDVWRCHGVVACIQNLIANEDTGQVVVCYELVEDLAESGELGLVPMWVTLCQLLVFIVILHTRHYTRE